MSDSRLSPPSITPELSSRLSLTRTIDSVRLWSSYRHPPPGVVESCSRTMEEGVLDEGLMSLKPVRGVSKVILKEER